MDDEGITPVPHVIQSHPIRAKDCSLLFQHLTRTKMRLFKKLKRVLRETGLTTALYLRCHEAGVPSSEHIATGEGQVQT